MTAADVPAPDLTVDEQRRVSRPAVDIAADVREEAAARAIWESLPDSGYGRKPWSTLAMTTHYLYRQMARAALAAARPPAPADDPAAAVGTSWPSMGHAVAAAMDGNARRAQESGR